MRAETAQHSNVQPQVVRCGKEELVINVTHVIAIVFIYLFSAVASEKIGYSLLFLNAVVYILFAIRVRKSGPVHLDLVFLFFLLIYSFSVPLSNALTEKQYNQDIVRDAADICMLSYLGFAIGLLLDSGHHRRNAILYRFGWADAERMRKSGMWVFFMGAVASFAAIALTSGLSAYLSAGYAGRALLKREAGPVELGLYISIVGLFAVFAAVNHTGKRSPISKVFVALVFLFFFFYISFLGIRRPLFLLGLGLLSGISLIRHRPKMIVALPIGLLAFAFLTTFAQYRQLISTAGINETLLFIQSNASVEWFDVSDTELGAPFRTLMDYLGDDRRRTGMLLGSSYLESILYVFPSFLTGRLESLSVEYTNTFFSSDFISIGGNMGLFPVTEAYLNFGAFGAFVIVLLFGIFLSKVNRWFHGVGRGRASHIILFMMLVPWTAFFMRLDFASFSKGFLYSQLVPYFLIVVLSKLQKSRAS